MTFGDFTVEHGKPTTGTYWPHGAGRVTTSELVRLLEGSGRRSARRAIADSGSSDAYVLLDVAVSAGHAIEMLVKAILCHYGPELLVDRSEINSMLHATDHGHQSDNTYLDIKSVTITQAVKNLKRIRNAPRLQEQDIKVILDVRNSATHLSLVEETAVRDSVRELVRVLDRFFPALGCKDADFWGPELMEIVDVLRNEVVDSSREYVAYAKAEANKTLLALTAGLDQAEKALVLRHLSGTQRPDVGRDEFVEERECPVCGQMGWLTGWVERGDLQHEAVNMHDVEVWVERTGHADHFACPVCRLQLEDEDVTEAGLDADLQLEADYDPYEAHEPEWY